MVILVDFGQLRVDLSVRRARSERFGAVLAVILVDFGQLGVDRRVRLIHGFALCGRGLDSTPPTHTLFGMEVSQASRPKSTKMTAKTAQNRSDRTLRTQRSTPN